MEIREIEERVDTWGINYHHDTEPSRKSVILKMSYPADFEISCEKNQIDIFCKEKDIQSIKEKEKEIRNLVSGRLWHLLITDNIKKSLIM